MTIALGAEMLIQYEIRKSEVISVVWLLICYLYSSLSLFASLPAARNSANFTIFELIQFRDFRLSVFMLGPFRTVLRRAALLGSDLCENFASQNLLNDQNFLSHWNFKNRTYPIIFFNYFATSLLRKFFSNAFYQCLYKTSRSKFNQ